MTVRKLLILFLFVLFSSVNAESADTCRPVVLVTLAPYKFFVQKIAGDTVTVIQMVPAGASGHTYEPTPRQILEASQGSVWFLIGEPFEKKASQALTAYQPQLRLVDMRQGVTLIGGGCCSHHSADPHIWLSPKEAKIQAVTIYNTLSQLLPENQALYRNNLDLFLNELTNLDAYLKTALKPIEGKAILVFHPAYGYLARDYGFGQYSIESEGRDPTTRELTKLLQWARQQNIRAIFVQPQYSTKGADLVAKTISARVIELNPYAEDYINSLHTIGDSLGSSSGKTK